MRKRRKDKNVFLPKEYEGSKNLRNVVLRKGDK